MPDATESEPEPSSSSCAGGGGGSSSGAKASAVSACTVCGTEKSSSSVLDLTANHVMQRRLSRDWKLPTEIISKTLRAICVECVCKLNMHSEVTRKLMLRLQRLTASANGNAVAAKTQKRCSPPIADAEVSTTGSALLQEELTASARVASPASSSSCSVLQAYSAQPPESPSATESGGMHNNGGKWRTRLVCQHCERVYSRKDHYTMHVRRCWRKHPQQRTTTKCRVLNEAANDDEDNNEGNATSKDVSKSVEVDGNTAVAVVTEEQTDPPRHSRTFQCKQCDKEFDGIVALRQHQRSTHQSLRRCSLCEAQFGTQYEWDLHHTICSAKQEALKLLEDDTARSMRSRSRSRASVWYNEDDDDDDDDEEKDEDEEEQAEADDQQAGEEAMFERRMNFTGDWIVNHSRSNSNSAINLNMLYDGDELEESQISSGKEYDLYMLDQLMSQVKNESFSCFAPNCFYQTDTLVDLMKHDYVHHWKMSWFYCHKCGDVFTSKVFLDYHLHQQNRGVYICHKCHEEFEFQHLLDRHQLLHNKGINYHCNYCRLEFLSEAKLLAHCERQRHSPNDEPHLICIDHELSISNPVPKEPKEVHKYSSRILNIPHRVWPSNRPMHLPQHKPFRFAIGICEFDNHNPPNCVGCH